MTQDRGSISVPLALVLLVQRLFGFPYLLFLGIYLELEPACDAL
jgi:hypothetical protein